VLLSTIESSFSSEYSEGAYGSSSIYTIYISLTLRSFSLGLKGDSLSGSLALSVPYIVLSVSSPSMLSFGVSYLKKSNILKVCMSRFVSFTLKID